MFIYIILIISFTLWAWLEYGQCSVGYNKLADLSIVSASLTKLMSGLRTSAFHDWEKVFGKWRNRLPKDVFDAVKMAGSTPIAKNLKFLSRYGVGKMTDILRQTGLRPTGQVLSLCSGRGGWDQVVAGFHNVKKVISVTLGKSKSYPGHEDPSNQTYKGREKVSVVFDDVKVFPAVHCDWLLFDGGEEHSDKKKEALRFNALLRKGVMKHVHDGLAGFIIRILTPMNPETLDMVKEIQIVTGKGKFIRSVHSRTTSRELYFVSLPYAPVEENVRELLITTLEEAVETCKPLESRCVELVTGREELLPKSFEIVEPIDMENSIVELGQILNVPGRDFKQWDSLGIYPFGTGGSSHTPYNKVAWNITRDLLANLQGGYEWKGTDTTAKGFEEVFRKKVDTCPPENTDYDEALNAIYQAAADYYIGNGFRYHELSWQEVYEKANKSGARGFIDLEYGSVGEFLARPDWQSIVEEHERQLLLGKPIGAVFNTMGKREKKKSMGKARGSRMVAYLPIPMRLLELKYFGCLMELTKPEMNHFGVGGIGLHDLGMRLNEVWKESGSSSDIAGFDTRVGIKMQSIEMNFCLRLGIGKGAKKFFSVYAFPHILIPIDGGVHRRSELLRGRGQRMSGSNITYSMNTETRKNLVLLQILVSKNVDLEDLDAVRAGVMELMSGREFTGCISGDDEVTSGARCDILKYAEAAWILHEIGFDRKDLVRSVPSPVCHSVEEAEFCSHRYTRVSYMCEYTGEIVYRYQPVRMTSEIVAKASIWLGTSSEELDEMAWVSAQGNNLLVNYHHIRTCRALGLAFKAIVNPNVTLGDKGAVFMRKPWMRDGEILEVINDILFGDSTRYPVANFCVVRFQHLGYLGMREEIRLDPIFNIRERIRWRHQLEHRVYEVITSAKTGGDISIMSLFRKSTIIDV